MNSPVDLTRLPLKNINGKPKAINGIAIELRSILKAPRLMSHAVAVVPILAPMISPIAWTSDSSPALTKLITITVVALEDWMMQVMNAPTRTRLKVVEVMAAKISRSRLPAIFCKDSLMSFIPNRKRPNDPMTYKICSIVLPMSVLWRRLSCFTGWGNSR